MIIRTGIILQTLLLGMSPDDQRSVNLDSSEENFGSSEETYQIGGLSNYGYLQNHNKETRPWPKHRLTPIPSPDDYAKMARFIVHNANWTSVAYISHQKGSENRALADMFSVSDGAVNGGSGIPYFYVSRLEAAITDLLDNNNQCSLTMGLAQTQLCKERNWDDEDPRCAHVVLTGTFKQVDTKSSEFIPARDALFSRHPSFKDLPAGHHFFVAKYVIDSVTLQDNFGGPVPVDVSDYFAVKDRSFGLTSSIKNYDDDFFRYFVNEV